MMNHDYETLLFEQEGAVATVTLNRPDRLNAMSFKMFDEISACFKAISADTSIRAVILNASGKHYTAGLDLQDAASGLMGSAGDDPARTREQFYRHVRHLQACFTALEDCPIPIIAAVHGACIGGGVDLICACDMRLAAEGSYFTIQEVEVAIVADIGTLQRLPSLIPPGIVRELAYTGRRYTCSEAAQHGFLNKVLPDQNAMLDEARTLASLVASKSPVTISGIKKTLLHARDHSVADGLDYVATWNAGMLMGEDLEKAVKATLTKQQADFADRLPDRDTA